MGTVREILGHGPLHARTPFVTDSGLDVARRFQTRPGDVLIVTYPKTGTTWCQKICHQLRTGGETDFDEIAAVMPWLEVLHRL